MLRMEDERFTTATTLPKLQTKFADSELWLLIGSDVFLAMNPDTWPGLKTLLTNVKLVIGLRAHTQDEIEAKAKQLMSVVGQEIGFRTVSTPHADTSSSKLKQGSEFLETSPAVKEYIRSRHLYE